MALVWNIGLALWETICIHEIKVKQILQRLLYFSSPINCPEDLRVRWASTYHRAEPCDILHKCSPSTQELGWAKPCVSLLRGKAWASQTYLHPSLRGYSGMLAISHGQDYQRQLIHLKESVCSLIVEKLKEKILTWTYCSQYNIKITK